MRDAGEDGAGKLTMDALAERPAWARARCSAGSALGRGSSRRCSTTTSGTSSSRCCPVPAGRRGPLNWEHIRLLLGQLGLGSADLDVLATQLTAALDGPLLLYLSSDALAGDLTAITERLGHGWEDLVRRVARP